MLEIGKVISVDDDLVTVSVERKAACQNCNRCGGHLAFGGNSMIVKALKKGDPRPGDLVELELPNEDYLRVSFLLYLFPLLSLALGYAGGWFLGGLLGNASVWGTVSAVVSFAASFLWLRKYDASSTKVGRYLPVAKPLKDDTPRY